MEKKQSNVFSLKILAFILLNIIFCNFLNAQQNDSININSKKNRKVKILPVPTFGYEPETKTHIGVVSLFTINLYQDSSTRVSNAKIEFNYTFRRQIILESEWDYFFKKEQWFSNGIIHASIYPDFYYGIGANTPKNNELLFNSNRTIIDVGLYKNIGKKIFVGGGLRYLNYYNISTDDNNPYEELQNASTTGLKTSIFQDTRNNILNATTGNYYLINFEYNFSSEDYMSIKLDLRKYFSLKHGFTLSTRFFNSFILNTPNFYDYSVLGGDQYVRGYFYGRYRDKHLTTLQTEIRTPLLWRFGLAFIGGISSLYPDFSAFADTIRPNYGIGLRFLMDKKDNINLRLDYVIGSQNNSGFYISFGESF